MLGKDGLSLFHVKMVADFFFKSSLIDHTSDTIVILGTFLVCAMQILRLSLRPVDPRT